MADKKKHNMDELVVKMTFMKAQEYLRNCVAYKQLLSMEVSEETGPPCMLWLDRPDSLSDIRGRALYCVVLTTFAQANPDLIATAERMVRSKFGGIELPQDFPGPRLILIED